jgi:ribonucleoside-triphosphate reductase (thioredoxin)
LTTEQRFKLTDAFIEKYKEKTPPFGFGGLGEFVYMRTYSRVMDNGKNESWWQTIQRVVEGIYNIQKEHIDRGNLGWNAMKSQKSAQEMYDLIFNIKFLPSGRALWALGSKLITEKRLIESLYNCTRHKRQSSFAI